MTDGDGGRPVRHPQRARFAVSWLASKRSVRHYVVSALLTNGIEVILTLVLIMRRHRQITADGEQRAPERWRGGSRAMPLTLWAGHLRIRGSSAQREDMVVAQRGDFADWELSMRLPPEE